jgi:hypothetical protein
LSNVGNSRESLLNVFVWGGVILLKEIMRIILARYGGDISFCMQIGSD